MSDTSLTALHALDGSGGAKYLSRAELMTQDPEQYLWMRCDLNDREDQRWLIDNARIPDFAVEALLAHSTRPRYAATEDGMLLILRGINLNPGAETDDMIAIRIWLEDRRIVTCQRRFLRSVIETADALNEERGPRRPSEVLIGLTERLSEYIEDALDGLSAELERVEDQVEQNPDLTQRTGLSALRRKAARMRRFLHPQREALDRLCRHGQRWLEADQIEDLQQHLDALMRHLEDLELVRERALLVREELQNRVAEEQNSRIYVLSIVTAIFLPLTFITGLFGMNVAGLPGTESPRSFLVVCLVSGIIGLGLAGLLRMKKWF